MEFGKFISTSNTFAEGNKGDLQIVTIETDIPLVWTISLKENEAFV